MEIKASELYKALKELGKLPKTLRIERITNVTDSVTGKQRKEVVATSHALVCVRCGDKTAVVDFDKLKSFVIKMKNELLSVSIDRISLCLSYKTGDFVLTNVKASPSATIDLDSVLKENFIRIKPSCSA